MKKLLYRMPTIKIFRYGEDVMQASITTDGTVVDDWNDFEMGGMF